MFSILIFSDWTNWVLNRNHDRVDRITKTSSIINTFPASKDPLHNRRLTMNPHVTQRAVTNKKPKPKSSIYCYQYQDQVSNGERLQKDNEKRHITISQGYPSHVSSKLVYCQKLNVISRRATFIKKYSVSHWGPQSSYTYVRGLLIIIRIEKHPWKGTQNPCDNFWTAAVTSQYWD